MFKEDFSLFHNIYKENIKIILASYVQRRFHFSKIHISGHLSILGLKLAQPRLPLYPHLNQQLKGELANIMIIIIK